MEFISAIVRVFLLVALAIPGFILQKLKKLPESFSGGLTTLILYVTLPVLTVTTFVKTPYEPQLLMKMSVVLLLSAILLPLAFIISKLAFSKWKDDAAKGALVSSGYLNNCAFMGIPVLQVFFPDSNEPVIYAVVFGVIFNIITWTLLVYTLTGKKEFMSIKRAFLNPPSLVLLIALPLFFLKVSLPSMVLGALDTIGGLTTPLSLIILGIRLAEIKPKEIFTSGRVYLSAFIKLIVVPAVTLAIMLGVERIFPIGSLTVVSMFMIMGMPTASSVIMFSEMFGGDSHESAKCILFTALLSILTIPLMALIGDNIIAAGL